MKIVRQPKYRGCCKVLEPSEAEIAWILMDQFIEAGDVGACDRSDFSATPRTQNLAPEDRSPSLLHRCKIRSPGAQTAGNQDSTELDSLLLRGVNSSIAFTNPSLSKTSFPTERLQKLGM